MDKILYFFTKYEFSIYLLICTLILIFICIILKRKKIKLIILSLVGFIIPIMLFEVFFASSMPVLISRKKIYFDKIDNLTKYKSRIYGTPNVLAFTRDLNEVIKINEQELIFDYVQETYSNGFRYTKSNLDAKEGFVFLGCSFTYGHGVKDEDTLTYQFAKFYDFERFIINCSCGGRGTNFSFSVMDSDVIYKFINKNQKVNYFIYSAMEDHINRNFNIRTFNIADDAYIVKNGKLSVVKEPLGVLKKLFQKSYIFNKFFLNIINKRNKIYYEQYFIEKLLEMNKLAKEKYDSEFIVIIWPGFQNRVIKQLENLDLNIIFLDNKFEDYKYKLKNDGHPNGLANKEIAQILFDYINNKS